MARLPDLFATATAAALAAHRKLPAGRFIVGCGTTPQGLKALDDAERAEERAERAARMRAQNLENNPAWSRGKKKKRPESEFTAIGKMRREYTAMLSQMSTEEQEEHRRKMLRIAGRKYAEKIADLARELNISRRKAKLELVRRNKLEKATKT